MTFNSMTDEALMRFINERTEVSAAPDLCVAPDVSVLVQTFNHEPYLARALDGILGQNFGGSVEILIGEDCSGDATGEVARRYWEENPDRIVLLRSTENLGKYTRSGRFNLLRNLEHSRGRFIALLEGDDFWTDPGKLQRQVDHLRANPGAAGCFTDCAIVDSAGDPIEPRPFWKDAYRDRYTQRECLTDLRSAYGTATLMFRGEVARPSLPEYFRRAGSDFLLDLAVTEHGTLDHLPGETAAYRIHMGGSWQGTNRTSQHLLGLMRVRALEEDQTMGARFPEEIAGMRLELAERILNLRPFIKKGSKFDSLSREETPALVSTGFFDFQKHDASELVSWLKGTGEVSWLPWSLFLAFRDGDRVDFFWWRTGGKIRWACCGMEELVPDAQGLEYLLPDFSTVSGMEEWSGKRIPRGLPFAFIEENRVFRDRLVDRLSELNTVRMLFGKIENSLFFKSASSIRRLLRGGKT